jgi:NTP pyrophosphatase (non-canonical NTP hydrolase)
MTLMEKDTLLTIGFRVPNGYLNALRDAIYQDAVEHGLWEENEKWPVTCATRISDEADELMDAGADWEDEGFYLDDPDQAYSEELADVVIMCMSVAGALDIDIDAAIRRKMEINKGRPWKHEGEKK